MPEGSDPVAGGSSTPPSNISQDQAVAVVTPDDIFAETGTEGKSPVKLGTWTQRAGMRLAAGVGALGALVTVAIVARWIWMSWCFTCPTLSSTLKADEADAIVKNYKVVQDQACIADV